MFDFLKSLFNPAPPSSTTAKERLRLVLLSDHLSLSPETVKALKADLLEVISRYVEIDPSHADVSFEHRENEVAMLANIPITGVRERKRVLAENAATGATAAASTASPTRAIPASPPIAAEPEPVAANEHASAQTTLDLAAEPADAPSAAVAPATSHAAATAEAAAAPVAPATAPQTMTAAQRRRRRKKAQSAAPRPNNASHLGKPAQA